MKGGNRKVNLIVVIPMSDGGSVKAFLTNKKNNDSIVFTFAEAKAEMDDTRTILREDTVIVSEDESHFKTDRGLIMFIQPVGAK